MFYQLNNPFPRILSTGNFLDIPKTVSNSDQNHSEPTQSKKIKRIRFSPQEDKELIDLVSKYGDKNWKKISEEISKKSTIIESSPTKIYRTPRQCKDRYINYLNPEINARQWTAEEDQCLMINSLLNKTNWRSMQKLFPGRSEVAIRNRFNYLHRSYLKELKPTLASQISAIKLSQKNGVVEIEEPSNQQNEIQQNLSDQSNFLNLDQSYVNYVKSNVANYCSENKVNITSSLIENDDKIDKKKVEIPQQWIKMAKILVNVAQTDEVKNSISNLKKKIETLRDNLASQNINVSNLFNFPFDCDSIDETDFFEMF